jgi:hypothetical protein
MVVIRIVADITDFGTCSEGDRESADVDELKTGKLAHAVSGCAHMKAL